MTWIMIGLVGISSAPMTAEGVGMEPLKYPSRSVPTYAGFDDIQNIKNHFIIIGDTQATSLWEFWRERNDEERKSIIVEIARREPAFVIHLGDLTTRGASKKHWREFDDLHKTIRQKKIPYFPILGNHDLYGQDVKALQNYFGRFPHLAHRRWYGFTWKNTGFILLDSNFSSLTLEEKEEQRKWYLAELERFEKDEKVDHVIVCCHEPPFTNSRVVHPNRKVQADFAGPFLKYRKTRLFFSGHNHSYERFQMGGKIFVVSGGGGGPRHKVLIHPEKRRYEDQFRGPELRFFHFVGMEVVVENLAYRVIQLNPDGIFTVTDSLKIPEHTQKNKREKALWGHPN